ncbi:hypothetical protein ACFE04_001283 [Oxalis oulophora]
MAKQMMFHSLFVNDAVAPPLEENKQNSNDAVNLLDIRVGQIIKAYIHQDADALYVEEVVIGKPEPRTICSGFVKYVLIEYLENRKVVVEEEGVEDGDRWVDTMGVKFDVGVVAWTGEDVVVELSEFRVLID